MHNCNFVGVVQQNVRLKAVWQLQPEVAQTVQQRVSYEFIWIRRTYDYI